MPTHDLSVRGNLHICSSGFPSALNSITNHSKCTLILEDIWLGNHNHVKGLDFTAAHVHDSASIWEFHLPVGAPIQLSAPANKMCLRWWWEWSMNHLMWLGGGVDLFITVHHCIILKPYFRWVGSHLPGLMRWFVTISANQFTKISTRVPPLRDHSGIPPDSMNHGVCVGALRDLVITFQVLGWRQHRGYYSRDVSSLSSDDQTHSSCRRNVAAWNHFAPP